MLGADPVGQAEQPGATVGSAPLSPSSTIVTTSEPFSRASVSDICEASACLTAFVTASHATKYAAVSTWLGNRSGSAETSSRTYVRAASSRSALPSPSSSDPGRSPPGVVLLRRHVLGRRLP